MSDKTVCVTDLGYVGLPLVLAFPGHPGVIGFDVDLARSPIEVMDQYAPPASVLMIVGEDG